MGRMLETLKRLPPRVDPVVDEAVNLRPFSPAPESAPAEVAEDELPYIEVGDPSSRLVGSPEVLSIPVTAAPAVQRARSIQPLPVPSPAVPPPRRPAVTFQPLSAGSAGMLSPAQRFAPELIAFHQPDHPDSDAYRTLLTTLADQLPGVRIQVLLFTAPSPGVCTTTVLLNVAITAARQGQLQVAVVDANFQRPAVAQRLGLPAAPGLREVLAGSISLSRALLETGQPNLHALPAGDVRSGGDVRVSRDALRAMLRQLRDRFELVLVDAPCWASQPDLVTLSAACDAVYLVLEASQEGKPEISRLIEMIARHGCQLRGCLLTQR